MARSDKRIPLAALAASLSLAAVTPTIARDLGELDCVIEPHLVVDLASRVDGIVESIAVERGDLVARDQLLVKLDSGVEEAAVAAARSRAGASAELEANNVSVEFAQRRRERLEALFIDKAVSRDQMDEISTETDLTKLQLQQAEENRRIAELELRQSLEILKRHQIRSPIDGVVVQRYLSPGESTEDQPILRLAQIDPLRVRSYRAGRGIRHHRRRAACDRVARGSEGRRLPGDGHDRRSRCRRREWDVSRSTELAES